MMLNVKLVWVPLLLLHLFKSAPEELLLVDACFNCKDFSFSMRFTVWVVWLNIGRQWNRKEKANNRWRQAGRRGWYRRELRKRLYCLITSQVVKNECEYQPRINSPRHQWFFQRGLEPWRLRRKWRKVYAFIIFFARESQNESFPNLQVQKCLEQRK